jgi:cytochrome P450
MRCTPTDTCRFWTLARSSYLEKVSDHFYRHVPLNSEAFINAFNVAQKGVGIRVLLGKMKFLVSRNRKSSDACALIKDHTQKHIDRVVEQQVEHESTQDQRNVILVNELAKETSDRSDLCSQLLNVFFAGCDTPAVALTNIFFLLARHHQVRKKCRAEVDGLQLEDLTFEQLKSLRYIQNAIKEGKNAGEVLLDVY